MKKLISLLLVLALCFCICGCSKSDSITQAKETINSFFTEFENGNYDKMKKYCTENCVKQFFHESDFFGIKIAKLESISDEAYEGENENKIGFESKIKVFQWAEIHQDIYEENESLTYILIMKRENNKWYIDNITTDSSEI